MTRGALRAAGEAFEGWAEARVGQKNKMEPHDQRRETQLFGLIFNSGGHFSLCKSLILFVWVENFAKI